MARIINRKKQTPWPLRCITLHRRIITKLLLVLFVCLTVGQTISTIHQGTTRTTLADRKFPELPSRGILIIDTRHPDNMIIPTLESVLNNTSVAWQVQLICSPDVANQLQKPSKFRTLVESHNRTFHITPWEVLDMSSYQRTSNKWGLTTRIMMNETLWQQVKFEKVLVIQPDSVMCKSGLDSFLQFDYIGAPWTQENHGMLVGNGGFSLRTRDVMANCASTYKFDNQKRTFNEDAFFANCVHDNPNTVLAQVNDATLFAMENIYNPQALAYHNPIYYKRSAERTKEMCDHCPAAQHVPEIRLKCN
jgi:hypothetical protein